MCFECRRRAAACFSQTAWLLRVRPRHRAVFVSLITPPLPFCRCRASTTTPCPCSKPKTHTSYHIHTHTHTCECAVVELSCTLRASGSRCSHINATLTSGTPGSAKADEPSLVFWKQGDFYLLSQKAVCPGPQDSTKIALGKRYLCYLSYPCTHCRLTLRV